MTFEFHVSGADRKELVKAMGEILEVKPQYLGMPTATYEVDYFTIDKAGAVSFDDRADSEEIENLLDRLAERGFTPENCGAMETFEEPEKSAHSAPVGLTVALPLDMVSVGKLTKLLDAKGGLIKKALGIDATPIELGEDAVSFPWFSEMPNADTAQAYTHFISALCQMSREQKRITATEKNVENEKYAFRCFLLRLGFIGAEYKTERKILLKNLTGSSAFKNGGADHAVSK